MQAVSIYKKKRSKGRKIITTLLLLVLVVLALLYFSAMRFLNSGQLRQEIESQLTAALGLPVQVEALDISLFPNPAIMLRGVRTGNETAYLRAASCDALIDWHRLAQRELCITTVLAHNVQLVLPQNPQIALDSIKTLFDTISQQRSPVSSQQHIRVAVNVVEAPDIEVVMGNATVAVGTVHVENATAPTVDIALSATETDGENTATLLAALKVERRPDRPARITGESALTLSRNIVLTSTAPPLHITAEMLAAFSGTGIDSLAFQLEGSADIASYDETTRGAFTAKAWWQQDALIVNDLQWHSPECTLLADATIPMQGEASAVHIHKAVVQSALVQQVLHLLPASKIRFAASDNTSITITNLLSGIELTPFPRIVSGDVVISRLAVADETGRMLVDELDIVAEIEEGKIRLHKIAGAGWSATGMLIPHIPNEDPFFELTATGPLNKKHLELFAPALAQQLGDISGNLQVYFLPHLQIQKGGLELNPYFELQLSKASVSFRSPGALTAAQFNDVEISCTYQDGEMQIEKASLNASQLRGLVQMGAGKALQLDLSGEIDLGSIPLSLFLPGIPLGGVEGYLDLTTLSATIAEGSVSQFLLAGTVRDGGGQINTPVYQDTLSAVSGSLQIENNATRFALTGNSERLGLLRCEGVFDPPANSVAGEVILDLGVAAGNLLPENSWRIPAAGIAADCYGQTGMTFAVKFPEGTGKTGSIELRRQGDPLLYFQAAIQKDGFGWLMGERSLQASAPLPLITKHLNLNRESTEPTTLSLETEGLLQVRYEQSHAQAPFALTLDGAACRMQWPPWISKAPGVPLRATIQGTGFQIQTVELMLNEQPVTLYSNGAGNYQARDVLVALDKLGTLISPDIALSGEALVSFNTKPIYVQAQLREAQATLLSEAVLGAINGIVIYSPELTELRDITLQGNGFDCRLEAKRDQPGWQAALSGARFDLNRFLELSEAVAKIRGLESPRLTGMTMPNTTGTLQIRLGEVAFRRGTMQHVSTTAQVTPEIITLEDLAFRVGKGRLVGRARLQPEHAGTRKPASLYANLEVDAVEMAHAENLLFKKPRDLSGFSSGTVEIQLPTGKEGFRRMDSKLQLRLWNGSLGKMGFATQLSTLLRSQEILLLRVPSFQDEGLTYDTARLSVSMHNGLAQLENCVAASPSYKIEAAGRVDFSRMQSDVQVAIDIFQGMADLVEQVPIIGPTANSVVREATRIRLRATGSPFDIQWQPDVIQ